MDKLKISEILAQLDTVAGEFYILSQTPLAAPSRQSLKVYSQGLTQATKVIRKEMFAEEQNNG